MFKNLSMLGWISLVLLLIGGINWGIVGIVNVNLISAIFGVGTLISRLIYISVGLSAGYLIYWLVKRP